VKTGIILESFNAKDGRNVILRTPKWEDLDDFIELFNSLVEEDADIHPGEKVTRDQKADWLSGRLTELEKGQLLWLVAEVDGKVIANSELRRKRARQSHVGEIDIAVIKKDYRNLGIGSEMIKALISQAETIGLKMLVLTVFSTNKQAIHIYEKLGFKETGQIPNSFYKNGKFTDEVIMVKQLTNL